ncbi:MAG: hypothetical protein ACR2J8_06025, partial [Thermomicrobiales bacterium]
MCSEEQPVAPIEPAGQPAPAPAPAPGISRRALSRVALALAGLLGVTLAGEPTQVAAKKKKKKTCPSGLARCGNVCVDRSTDAKNCGSCGKTCGGSQICAAGKCACAKAGTTPCGAKCVNLQTSSANCGACGVTCAGELICVNGSCGCATPGNSKCGTTCVNTQTNENNCGACGNVCTGDLTCVNGACGCADTSLSICNVDKCRDTQTSMTRCGSCTNVCDTDLADNCTGGVCKCGSNAACPDQPGSYCSNGSCLDLRVCASGCDYTTVQDAIDAAPAGAVIPIASGSYDGKINIAKDITLSGAGKA